MNDIADNIRLIQEKIARASSASGHSAGDITLVAVTKTFPEASISDAIAAGLRQFGENRVQEAEGKILNFRSFPGVEWHLIGHLQSNKARRATELFQVIHSLDSVKLAIRLDQAARETGKTLSVLIQVDLGGEETKFGVPPDRIREMLEAVTPLGWLRLDGLMTIPPYFENPDDVRPYFAELRKWSERLEAEQPGCLGKRHLSMGMSHDFEAAIREGATMIRIGTAIFGPRQHV
jgi:pyridoxal phosphate enzyme (YggS family)